MVLCEDIKIPIFTAVHLQRPCTELLRVAVHGLTAVYLVDYSSCICLSTHPEVSHCKCTALQRTLESCMITCCRAAAIAYMELSMPCGNSLARLLSD